MIDNASIDRALSCALNRVVVKGLLVSIENTMDTIVVTAIILLLCSYSMIVSAVHLQLLFLVFLYRARRVTRNFCM